MWKASIFDEKSYHEETLKKLTISNPDDLKELNEDNLKPFVVYYDWLMSHDRKEYSLKLLQGMIWKKGYEDGTIKGQ